MSSTISIVVRRNPVTLASARVQSATMLTPVPMTPMGCDAIVPLQLQVTPGDGTYETLTGRSYVVGIGNLNGQLTGGTWTVTDSLSATSTPIAYNAPPLDVQNALNAMNGNTGPNGALVVVSTPAGGGPYLITWVANGNQALLTVNGGLLTPQASVIQNQIQAGSGSTPGIQNIKLVATPLAIQSVWSISGTVATANLTLNTQSMNQMLAADPSFSTFFEVQETIGSTTQVIMQAPLIIKGEVFPPGSSTTITTPAAFAVWGQITGTLSSQTDLQNALNLLAPLASPALTGVPTAPTAALGTNTTQIATTAYVLAAAGIIPSQAGLNSSYFLSTNGTNLAWQNQLFDTGGNLSLDFINRFGYDVTGTIDQPSLYWGLGAAGPNGCDIFLGDGSGGSSITMFTTDNPAGNGHEMIIANYNGNILVDNQLFAADGATVAIDFGSDLGCTVTTQAVGDNSAYIATTAFVAAELAAGSVTSIAGTAGQIAASAATGAVTLSLVNTAVTASSYGSATSVATFTVDAKGRLTAAGSTTIAITESQVTNLTSDLALKSPLASPTFTGTPAAPTASPGTNTTQLATTSFVATSFLATATAASTYAPLASPALTGTPTAPTASVSTSTTQIATTAFVATSFLTTATAATTYAPLASPTFTGAPLFPTGSAAAPGMGFSASTNTGIYYLNSGIVAISCAGVETATFDVNGVASFQISQIKGNTSLQFRLVGGSQANGSQFYYTGNLSNASGTYALMNLAGNGGSIIGTGGSYSILSITPTYNQASGTAANTDLLINRTQTAVGSGAQLLIDAQVGSSSKFSVSNVGSITCVGSLTTGTPSGGTAGAWKTGILVSATSTVNLTQYIQLDVGGTLYKLATMN